MKVEEEQRREAHMTLDRWLNECEREGEVTFDSGRSGYIGRIKLCAFVDDDGISLRVERAFSEEL